MQDQTYETCSGIQLRMSLEPSPKGRPLIPILAFAEPSSVEIWWEFQVKVEGRGTDLSMQHTTYNAFLSLFVEQAQTNILVVRRLRPKHSENLTDTARAILTIISLSLPSKICHNPSKGCAEFDRGLFPWAVKLLSCNINHGDSKPPNSHFARHQQKRPAMIQPTIPAQTPQSAQEMDLPEFWQEGERSPLITNSTPLEIIPWSIPDNTSCNQICITYSCIVDARTFEAIICCCWAAPTGRKLRNIVWYLGSQNALGKKYALHIRDVQAPPNKSCMSEFRQYGSLELWSPWPPRSPETLKK